ncbi:MAG: formiminoglutamase, partial [Cyclobacteriaceae bacterium]|nr:formiminoglutamase [Cyclobacteriaceae bacterium]
MDLKLFFSPVPEECIPNTPHQHSFYHGISAFTDSMPAKGGQQIALIGLEEARGCEVPDAMANAANIVRRKLYQLKKGTGNYRIIDLGNLKNGISREET